MLWSDVRGKVLGNCTLVTKNVWELQFVYIFLILIDFLTGLTLILVFTIIIILILLFRFIKTLSMS